MSVHNLMEDVVKKCLNELIHTKPELADLDEKSQSDIMAIALNKLPVKYVSTLQGEMYGKSQIGLQGDTDVYRELSYAIEKVQDNTRSSIFKDK